MGSVVMTIGDLFSIIKDSGYVPTKMHLSSLHGKIIAIDAPAWIHRFGKSSGTDWLKQVGNNICILKKNGIKPLFIFDGDNHKEHKQSELDKRAAVRAKNNEKLEECTKLLDQLHRGLAADLDYCIKVLGRSMQGRPPLTNVFEAIPHLERKVASLTKATTKIDSTFTVLFQDLLSALNIPFVHVDGEAEAIAARLLNSNIVDAIMTEDSDAFAYGCKRVLCFKDMTIGSEMVYIYDLPVILDQHLKMNYLRFRDLCILLGTDYNIRAKGFPPDGRKRKSAVNIGAKGALAIMTQCQTLEEAVEKGYILNVDVLNVDTCRFLLSSDMAFKLPPLTWNTAPNYLAVNNVYQSMGVYPLDQNYIAQCFGL